MADSTTKLLLIVCVLVLISHCYGDLPHCTIKYLTVTQAQTGVQVQGKPQWKVTISNKCCVQSDVKLDCRGFQTVEKVDPSVLKVEGDACLVNGGNIIYEDPVIFTYAWDHSFPLSPIYSEVSCS
ncbi:uncharacterized protein LOC130715339 [Lotus japonicus]|uniref:uncharacterized protein LOC130715339 n=1 Tax=Lotus japonicus TaxID=34305 RepID=UPI002588901D|nr:uncharacterized protein LOC130715339 [Lotus japonicus]